MYLVTGADGIVGRAVCDAFTASGQDFKPLVRRRQTITSSQAFISDLAVEGSLDSLLNFNISGIVHLAAAVPHSIYYPDTESTADLTRRMDDTILSFQQELNIPLIYMSTCGLYDRSIDEVKCEDNLNLIKVESPYFAAKLEGEEKFLETKRASILRLSAPVGPGLKPNIVLSRFVMAALSGTPIEIWGSGTREQNFIDVRDVATLIVKVMQEPHANIMNVAALNPVSMSTLAQVVIETIGQGTCVYANKSDPRDGETARYSILKAKDLYGWIPEYDLASSIRLIMTENFENNK